MGEKFLLYLSDEGIILSKNPHEILHRSTATFADARQNLDDILSTAPKIPLRLLIDRSHQDIREEKIPLLRPWDRIRFISHKKAEWQSQGGVAGFQFLRQDKETYFRWIHLPQNDSLIPWLLWAESLANPSEGVFFVPLESGTFLKNNLPLSSRYQMILYPVRSSETRHVIFKGNRLLLSRMAHGEESLKSSLQFLSRNYPDIHENTHVLSLIDEIPNLLPHVKRLPDSQALLSFISTLKHPSLVLTKPTSSKRLWVLAGAVIALLTTLLFTGLNAYQGIHYKTKTLTLLPEIEVLKAREHDLTALLGDKDVSALRLGSDHYRHLKSLIKNPLETIEKLAVLLKTHQIRLENLRWHHGQELEMIMSFLMEDRMRETLAERFESFLTSARDEFPGSQIEVLEGPFNSSTHEIFKSPSHSSHPLAQVRILFP